MKIKMDDERHKKEFEEVRKDCPWRHVRFCKATTTNKNCTQDNCAPYFFRKFFERRVK